MEHVKLKTKRELLDQLEQSALIIAGELVISKTGLFRLQLDSVEEQLGNIMDATLALKQLEGVPTNLKKVEKP